jgi:tRNA A-37 threonylcarbamoyl transferase component Bud32
MRKRSLDLFKRAQCPYVLTHYDSKLKMVDGKLIVTMSTGALKDNEIRLDQPVDVHLILCGIARAFAHLHRQGIVFETLSRANVGLNEEDFPFLLDFTYALIPPDVGAPSSGTPPWQPLRTRNSGQR